MVKKLSNGTPVPSANNGESTSATRLALHGPEAETPLLPQGGVDDNLIDPGRMPQGLRLIGVIVSRLAREFETFVKVFYEVECGSDKYLMAEMMPKPLDPSICLGIGECGAWEVGVQAYQDKAGKLRTQLMRKTGTLPSMPGTKPF